MRCHWIVVDGERIHIPGCMGAANSGPGGCTCPARNSGGDLMDRVADIRLGAKFLAKEIKDLLKVCDRFEAMQIKIRAQEKTEVNKANT